jgi:hypothetical protein
MPDGYRIVQMTSVTALDRESAFMGHCVGQGGYDKALETGSRQFFSLRDADNKPHAKFEVDPAENALLQCKGKENKPPVARYMPQVRAFLTRQKYRFLEAPAQTGLIEQDGNYYDIMHLPDGLHYRGTLYLRGTSIASLPEGLHLGGNLFLTGTRIATLPEGLQVAGDLYLPEGLIFVVPVGASIGGSIVGQTAPDGFAQRLRDESKQATIGRPR